MARNSGIEKKMIRVINNRQFINEGEIHENMIYIVYANNNDVCIHVCVCVQNIKYVCYIPMRAN